MPSEKKLNLQTTIDENSGFCFGVVHAIKKAEKHLDEEKEVYCVGQIVHNEEEIARLEKKGLITIDHKKLKQIKNQNILFRAHGEPPSSYKTSEENQNKIIDATCPIILKIHKNIEKAHKNNENIFIFGKHNHPEVIGLNGHASNEAIVFETLEELKKLPLPRQITLFSQTTKSLQGFNEVVDYLKNQNVTLKINDTICRQVSNREEELSDFCRRQDKIVFIAGKNSANGKILYNVCKEANSQSFFISSEKEIDANWFAPNEKVGICGATSTPQWLLEKAKEKLENL